MDFLITLFAFFWFVEMIGAIFFWVYLWQLKEYHIGRFIDHFRTHKGKKVIFGILPVLKIILFVLLLFIYSFFEPVIYILLIVYILEFLNILRGFKKPVFTKKVILLAAVLLGIIGIYA